MAENPKNVVQSVAKAFGVLQAFQRGADELTISEIAARTDLDRGTSFRLIHTLRDLGYVAAVPDSKRFRLTLKCLELGHAALAHRDLKTLARPLLAEIVAEVADAASLGMLDGTEVVYVERVEAEIGRRSLDRRTGTRTGIHAAALGQAILAFDTPEKQRDILERSDRVKLSERTITDVELLMARLAEIRERGWAASDGENAYGLRTVAAPIFDERGAAVASISATVRAERYTLDQFVTVALPRVRKAVDELTRAIRLSFGEIRVDPTR